MNKTHGHVGWVFLAAAMATSQVACSKSNKDNGDPVNQNQTKDGPVDQGPDLPRLTGGDKTRGEQVFRFETFGNEGFWTDAARLPTGIVAAKLTPVQALQAGLSVNVDALDAATKTAVANELASQGTSGPLLNDPATTLLLINANAVIGVVVKDTNGDGKRDVASGDKVGVSCALCHAITDGSVVKSPNNLGGGSIGKQVDGPTPHNLNVGGIFAIAANTRALYPLLQVKLAANGNKSIGRAPSDQGLTETSTEAQVDALVGNPAFYPLGTFDDAPDGTGAQQHIAAFFRTDLAAPWGTPGDIARLENFNNLVYTALLDPTSLVTPDGRAFLRALGGVAAGNELADDYLTILKDTQVKGKGGVVGEGFPYITATQVSDKAGTEEAPVGLRVNEDALRDLNAYTDSLAAPAPGTFDATLAARGKEQFTARCTNCHNVDQGKRVPSFIVPMKSIFPGYNPTVIAQRPEEAGVRPIAFAPIQDDPASIFDDKTVVVEASRRGEPRGSAMPLLLDLGRKDRFLHDSSVVGLASLLDPARGDKAPHAVYVPDAAQRAELVEFLKSL
ncbi:hypothetical protein [Myxococcus llanfairpwllgwyngyllgogerychwyrndrobwllllantysiliogogogochensis]|uniref:hypothetical protein n=1 Tax=Myxococcus llanfairpwllgwyngyllgogerychwyrndrobwllllantysiliogogogochensis TaxID=2590453 RepID=UPI001FECEB64|nr:hypothetical protein [Myxococcus llanfairpwllgwyngyllgogerychwyrndrobwllllantysiliogogogochensis]